MNTKRIVRWIGVFLPQCLLAASIFSLAAAIYLKGAHADAGDEADGEAKSSHELAAAHGTSSHGSSSQGTSGHDDSAHGAPSHGSTAHGGAEKREASGKHGGSAKSEAAVGQSGDPLRRLLDGNRRFASGQSAHPNQQPERRTKVAQKQEPFAVVLCCADSRVAPEVVFDQGLGDLFVVRVAGNSVDPAILGSIEYAVEHLKSPLIFVMGHERCGAVKAATAGGEAPAHIGSVLEPILPAVKAAKAKGGDVAEYAMRGHVLNMVDQLRKSKPVLAELIGEGKLSVAGGRYDLDTGKVEILE